MVVGTLSALGLMLMLVLGWLQFFNERAKHEQMAKLTAAGAPRSSLMAAQRDSDEPPAAPSVKPVVTAPQEPAATLQDIAQDDNPPDLAPLVRMAAEVTPDQLAAAAVLQKFWHAA
ncbi:MAG: hypothetical protein JWO94_468, partial [Verrucomicrobiaceae bacterium]|nr:hypothetical protein [Verrucomicrobiaceae bacterium]